MTAELSADLDWLDAWLREQALPLWWRLGADRVRGGWYDALTFGLVPQEPRRARVQARQAFVYATAGRIGWDGPWREALWHGLDALVDRYRRPDGLYRAILSAEGDILDDTPRLYEQAFALLAMAAGHQADPGRRDLPGLAADLLAALDALRHPAGGFRETYGHPFQANAQMHLFEAALAWIEAGGGAAWAGLAAELAELALTRFIDAEGGFLREAFEPDWSPARGEAGRLIEPGHQFEWAWLLDQWGARASHAPARAAARRLFEVGLAGVDPERRAAVGAVSDTLQVREPRARLWGQTEWLRAALWFGDAGRQAQAAAGLRRFLEAAPAGLWCEYLEADGRFAAIPAPASSFYHLIGALAALPKNQRPDGASAPPGLR